MENFLKQLRQVTVIIRDQNDNAPVFTSSATVTIDENTTAVTTLATTDADTNPTVTYSITGGADASSFAVTTDGVLTLTTAADYESGKTSYEVTVTATDNDDTNSTTQDYYRYYRGRERQCTCIYNEYIVRY